MLYVSPAACMRKRGLHTMLWQSSPRAGAQNHLRNDQEIHRDDHIALMLQSEEWTDMY